MSAVIALVRCEQSGRTDPPKKRQKVAPSEQNIALFLYSSTMTLRPLSAPNFKMKVGIMYSINSDDLFFRVHYNFGRNIKILDVN